jgi:hypothetical protein
MSGRRPGLTLAAFLLALLARAPLLACSVCYGNADPRSPLLLSARMGVFLLLAVTAAVLGAFLKFFVYLSRRARQAESETIASEWAHLQRSSSP